MSSIDFSVLLMHARATGMNKNPMLVLGSAVLNGSVDFPECYLMLADLTEQETDFGSLMRAAERWSRVSYEIWWKYHTEEYPDHPAAHEGCYPTPLLEDGCPLNNGQALGFAFCDRYYRQGREGREEREDLFIGFQAEFQSLDSEEKADCITMILVQTSSLIHQILKLKGYNMSDPGSLMSAIDQLKFD